MRGFPGYYFFIWLAKCLRQLEIYSKKSIFIPGTNSMIRIIRENLKLSNDSLIVPDSFESYASEYLEIHTKLLTN